MLDALVLAALLSVTDPPGDAHGLGLTAPTATLLRQGGAFDILKLEVLDRDTLTLTVTLGGVGGGVGAAPQEILEVYLSSGDEADGDGTRELLPGSGLQLPPGASWHYAVRIIGESVQVFSGQGGGRRDVTESSGARLGVSGGTQTLTTELPLPKRFSVYAMSGSYDPFSPDGWRTLRETPSPWGFSGAAPTPVLDIVAESAAVQERALEGAVLPEIRASFAQPGWLLVAGAGVAIALAGVAARFVGRRTEPILPAKHLAPVTEKMVRQRAGALEALAKGQGKLVPVAPEPEQATPLEPVLK